MPNNDEFKLPDGLNQDVTDFLAQRLPPNDNTVLTRMVRSHLPALLRLAQQEHDARVAAEERAKRSKQQYADQNLYLDEIRFALGGGLRNLAVLAGRVVAERDAAREEATRLAQEVAALKQELERERVPGQIGDYIHQLRREAEERNATIESAHEALGDRVENEGLWRHAVRTKAKLVDSDFSVARLKAQLSRYEAAKEGEPEGTIHDCPCCGCAHAEIQRDDSIFRGQNYGNRYPASVSTQSHGFRVKCPSCGLETCWWHYESKAVSTWNRRDRVAALKVRVEDLERENAELRSRG